MAAVVASQREPAECLPSNSDDRDYQGPHNYWRKKLKPVHSPVHENKGFAPTDGDWPTGSPREMVDSCGDRSTPDRRTVKEDRFEDTRIRERLKAMPTWRKDLIERKTRGPVVAKPKSSASGSPSSSTSSRGATGLKRRTPVLLATESPFTRQVVNKPISPGVPRKHPSPANSFRQGQAAGAGTASVKRTPSLTVGQDNVNLNSEGAKKRIVKVQKARLYLLQQMGPNSFLIGGDSPDHKYRVIIGPQTCSCGRGPHCIHILFVMLRVFQVSETDQCLWTKTLKNYEVENLFRNYHARRTTRIKMKSKRPSKPVINSGDQTADDVDATSVHSSEIESSKDDAEEETCPICLLEMVEGESLVECEIGCQNKYHHHCIAVWFEECKRQKETMVCPLCRAKWKTSPEDDSAESTQSSEIVVPPNTRSSSPQPQEADVILPHAEPILPEHKDTAAPWIPVLGEDLVSCLFSRNWVVRETSLRHVSRTSVGSLLLGVGEGRTGAQISPGRQATTHNMLDCCCSVLAFVCNDPVYKVFVAGLRTLRTVLSYTPCRDTEQQKRLQDLLKPVVGSILLKCADGNRRTSQLSISTLLELVKGQSGELALGREIVNPGDIGIGGVGFIVDCIVHDYEMDSVQWQWLLGRLLVLDRLIDEHPMEFIVRHDSSCCDEVTYPPEHLTHYSRLMEVIKFCLKALPNSHIKIAKEARRVFVMAARLATHQRAVFHQIMELLNSVDSCLQMRMKRRLLGVAEEFHVAQQMAWMVQQNDNNSVSGEGAEPEAPNTTPEDTPTPYSTSPLSSPLPTVMVNSCLPQSPLQRPTTIPIAPPNSPQQRRQRNADLLTNHESESVSDTCSSCASAESAADTQKVPTQCESVSGMLTPPNTPQRHSSKVPSQSVLVNQLRTSLTDLCNAEAGPQENESNSSQKEAHLDHCMDLFPCNTDTVETSNSYSAEGTITDTKEKISTTDLAEGRVTETHTVKKGSISQHKSSKSPSTPLHRKLLEEKANQSIPQTSSGTPVTSPESRSDPPYCVASTSSSTPCTPYGYSSAVLLTEDLSDLTMSPSSPENSGLVSFKTEVAVMSPEHSNNGSSEACSTCKEEVELEEAKALVAAMEKSNLSIDKAHPSIPGLSGEQDRALTITININLEGDITDTEEESACNYLEDVHWKRGPMIGTGAFSTCYQARDVQTGTIMAVKQISFCRNSPLEQQQVIEAVREEIVMMSNLKHPNVVRILGATQQTCHFFMFVEWMPGGSVAYLLERYGAFCEQVMVNYTQQVLRGLAYLHDNHILHRDLKGANLLVDSTGQRLKIGDFGAAARLASRTTGAGEFQGQLLGTIAFMAPEVLRGESYGRKCDVWSVGCVMIEMLTRKPPWGASDVSNHLALIFKIASSISPPPIPDNLSPPVRDLLLRCLEHHRDDRPPAKELLQHPLFTQCNKR